MSHQQALTKYIAAFISELVKNGVEDVVVSPGSRSTPMAMVMAEHPDLQVHIHVDERSAAFFALGIAKGTKRPVAILCTSGTAAANYYPAIIEAFYSRVPLLVFTADRPHELRDIGAPQAIDQIQMYGKHVKWFAEMAPPENGPSMINYVRTAAVRAVATAKRNPEGPVHMNFPFREPLIPDLNDPEIFLSSSREEKYMTVSSSILTVDDAQFDTIAQTVSTYNKGMIICGPMDDADLSHKIVELGKALQFPIIADPLSQLRSGRHEQSQIIDAYDAILKSETAKVELQPELIIRFGAMPVSKPLLLFMKQYPETRQLIVDGGGGFRDPSLLSTDMIYCDEKQFCEELILRANAFAIKENGYLTLWQDVNEVAKKEMVKVLEIEQLNEGKIFAQLGQLLPEESTVFVGNSMPIRDLDSFYFVNNKSMRIIGNRGANGIDGTISTALGVAMHTQPLYLIVGDLTFFHDLNGLIASKLYHIPITIIVINNNGGGIFSFLLQSEHPKHFELLFGTPLNIDFSHSVTMFGGDYIKVEDWQQFSEAIATETSHLKVIEVMTNRENNVKEHRNLWESVSREIDKRIKDEE